MFKEHKEFHSVCLDEGWASPEGYPENIQEKILSGYLDEENKKGTRTRLLRFLPGAMTEDPFIHDYFEEVYLVSGDLTVGKGEKKEEFYPNTYASRPPQTYHGPFSSKDGCILLEIHFYE
ncbi:DUF4437 domain-containing protein [Photobacterium ganghwense]|uniref:DUF4437 domain-containing protein n=1 Tax=Photobacterium ganghwense TaxID=320778 RepID=UPI001C2D5BAD|nr:DUF4437 domain-containing protein [Photobacterium ganghwense]MBV1842724.1 cupin domain-containing protein [Photobacterium ganghwense]